MKELDAIYTNLKAGNIYAEYKSNVRFPCYYSVLSYDKIKNLFHWTNYGSSANKATKPELQWIIETIFKMMPAEFIKTYSCVTRQEYNKI